MTTTERAIENIHNILTCAFCDRCEETKCDNKCPVFRAHDAADEIVEEARR
jgi:hypothetical protein